MTLPQNLRQLIEQGMAFPAFLPEKNDYLLTEEGKAYRTQMIAGTAIPLTEIEQKLHLLDLDKLDLLQGYTLPLLAHDYSAKTATMWNTLYSKHNIPMRNIMLVADPNNIESIFAAFRSDPKYCGGGLGVGFKEKALPHLSRVVPSTLTAANIAVKEGNELVGYNTDALGFVRSLEDSFASVGKKIEGSTIIVFGAGGVAQEVVRVLAEKKVGRIEILNRTSAKAVALAHNLNMQYGEIAIGGAEDIIRGYMLNSFTRPDAAINLTDKGSDGPLRDFAAFAATNDRGNNEYISRSIARHLKDINPDIIIADIVLPKGGDPITLRIARSEGLTHLLNGIPMVINQAAPAYVHVQNAHSQVHTTKVTEEEALILFREAAAPKL